MRATSCRWIVLAASLPLLAGCGSGNSSEASPTDAPATGAPSVTPSTSGPATVSSAATPAATATPAIAASACNVLTLEQVRAVLPSAQAPSTVNVAGAPACRWAGNDGSGVQVARLDAARWASTLPQAVKQLRSSETMATPENLRKLQASADLIRSGHSVTSEQACGLFSDLLEVAGAKAGSTRTLRLLPDEARPLAVVGQACTGGVYTSVMLAAPNTPDSVPAAAPAVDALLTTASRR